MSSSKSDVPEPLAYTPFVRRWTDERACDIRETVALYRSVRARYLASPYASDDALKDFVIRLATLVDTPLHVEFCVAIDGILRMEDSIFGFPQVNPEHISLKEQVDLLRLLRAKDYFFAHEKEILDALAATIFRVFSHIAKQLPKTLAPSPFVVPLAYALPNPKKLIEDLFATFWQQEHVKNGLFVGLSRQLYFNLCAASGISDPEDPKKPFLIVTKNAAPLSEIIDDYLRETPFQEFFNEPLPLQLTHEERFSHTHLLGGSGAGKTQMLQQLLLHDLQSDDRPALVIVDSQGDLIDKILRLDLPFDPILVSPKDVQNPPALNIFDVKRLDEYDEAKREQVTAGTIETLQYVLNGLLGADLTPKQNVFFKFVVRLLISLPDTMGRAATMMDMLHLMQDTEPYRDAITKLPDLQRTFFENDFVKSKVYVSTREEIRYRLMGILENPTLARLFTSSETKLDIFTELNSGSVILVDTAKDFLKGASSHFGRIFISLVLQAVLERAVIPEGKRNDTFLFIDEASQYFDQNIDDFLTEARKYKCGVVLAHQFLEQCTPSLRASLAANTSIKMAGGISTSDARSMAAEMRTVPDFILGQPRLHFACHIRNVTPQAVSIPVKAGQLEKQPRRSQKEYDLLIARNRERVCSLRPETMREAAEPEAKYTPNSGTESTRKW